jgi:hypothetical protein
MSRLEEAMTQLERAGREVVEHRRLRDSARQIAARVDDAPAWIDPTLRGAG